jgi:hypothetical protein
VESSGQLWRALSAPKAAEAAPIEVTRASSSGLGSGAGRPQLVASDGPVQAGMQSKMPVDVAVELSPDKRVAGRRVVDVPVDIVDVPVEVMPTGGRRPPTVRGGRESAAEASPWHSGPAPLRTQRVPAVGSGARPGSPLRSAPQRSGRPGPPTTVVYDHSAMFMSPNFGRPRDGSASYAPPQHDPYFRHGPSHAPLAGASHYGGPPPQYAGPPPQSPQYAGPPPQSPQHGGPPPLSPQQGAPPGHPLGAAQHGAYQMAGQQAGRPSGPPSYVPPNAPPNMLPNGHPSSPMRQRPNSYVPAVPPPHGMQLGHNGQPPMPPQAGNFLDHPKLGAMGPPPGQGSLGFSPQGQPWERHQAAPWERARQGSSGFPGSMLLPPPEQSPPPQHYQPPHCGQHMGYSAPPAGQWPIY